jgi:hypothetical protein
VLYLLKPIPFSFRTLTLPSLFGGKLHAILCREYQGERIKGRDYYDFVWYVARKVRPDLNYLRGKLCESGAWREDEDLTMADLKVLLTKKVETIDWENAKLDVNPFIKDSRELDLWSTRFFLALINRL